MNSPPTRLTLFVAGRASHSRKAVNSLRALCKEHFGRADAFDVVDVYEHPDLALKEEVFLTPALIINTGETRQMIIGNLSDPEPVARLLSEGPPP